VRGSPLKHGALRTDSKPTPGPFGTFAEAKAASRTTRQQVSRTTDLSMQAGNGVADEIDMESHPSRRERGGHGTNVAWSDNV
jgi:hypothetical protein